MKPISEDLLHDPWCTGCFPDAGLIVWTSDGATVCKGHWHAEAGWKSVGGAMITVTHWLFADEDPEEVPELPNESSLKTAEHEC